MVLGWMFLRIIWVEFSDPPKKKRKKKTPNIGVLAYKFVMRVCFVLFLFCNMQVCRYRHSAHLGCDRLPFRLPGKRWSPSQRLLQCLWWDLFYCIAASGFCPIFITFFSCPFAFVHVWLLESLHILVIHGTLPPYYDVMEHLFCLQHHYLRFGNWVILQLNGTFHRELVPYDYPLVALHSTSINFYSTCGACSIVLFEIEWRATYFGSLRAKVILASFSMQKWVWPSMNQY